MEKLEQRMDRIEQHLSQLIGMVAKLGKDNEERFISLENRMISLENKIISLENRMTSLENKFNSFQQETLAHFNNLERTMEHLALKWVETDRKLYFLRERQSE